MAMNFANILSSECGRPRHEYGKDIIQRGAILIQHGAPAQAPGKNHGIVPAARNKDGIQDIFYSRARDTHNSNAAIAGWRCYGTDGRQNSYCGRSAFLRIITTRFRLPSPVLRV